jgi:simple sugar transport system ATP-binding protein
MMNPTDILELSGITKTFGDVTANDHIDLKIEKGEIHTFLGENGAGKSTLVNIIYGFLRPDEGIVYFEGKEVHFESPRDAMKAGIGMVHQHFMLVPTLSVAGNVILGIRSKRWPVMDIEDARAGIEEYSSRYKLRLNPDDEIWKLSVGDQQWVEIIKALYLGVKLLILDEPTAVMTPQEIEGLLNRIKEMKSEGLTIIFISHKLDEVMSISDRISIFKKGKLVSTLPASKVTKPELARMMVGREVLFQLQKPVQKRGKPILKLENVEAYGDKGLPALNNISIDVHEGEIFGIAGVSGNGQKELYEVLTGIRKTSKGRVWINEKDVTNRTPGEIQNFNFSDIPDDKIKEGVVLEFSISENLILGLHRKRPFAQRGLIDHEVMKQYAGRLISEYDIYPPLMEKAAGTLSGGNLQKLVLAREISKKPKLIVASQPTRGLDVAASEFTRKKLLEERKKGTAILLISEDLDEIRDIGFLMTTGKSVQG